MAIKQNKCLFTESECFKTRFRFTEQTDMYLLKEVCGLNTFEDPKRWATIQENVAQICGKMLNIRTLRDRVQNLTKKFLAKKLINDAKYVRNIL